MPVLACTLNAFISFLQSLVNIGYEIGANKIALISSSQSTVASFLSESTTLGIRVPEILELIPKQVNIGLAVEGFLRGLRRQLPVVAMILDAADIVAVAEHLKNIELPNNPTWLIGSLGLELRRLKSWKAVYKGGAFVEPHMPELREFKNFFLDSLTVRLTFLRYNYKLNSCPPCTLHDLILRQI